jgi:6-phosphofructokinase 1
MIIELMGHKAGWITLFAGMAGGADVILIPELGYNIQQVIKAILARVEKGKSYSIVAVCEGLDINDKRIEYETGIETRKTILGYVQRGGSPSAFDRNLATRLGGHATELIVNRQFNRMVCVKEDQISSVSLLDVAGKTRLVEPDHDLIIQGKRMGISFGID